MEANLTVEMVNDARDEIDNVFKLNNSELSIIPRSQRETRDIINYALDRLNGEIMDKVFKDVRTGEWITVSKEEMKKSVKDTNDKRKRERIESEMKKEYLFKDPQGYKEFHKPIVIKREEIYPAEELELNEEAISKLCDDLIEAKKKPLSAAQIIDKYARRD